MGFRATYARRLGTIVACLLCGLLVTSCSKGGSGSDSDSTASGALSETASAKAGSPEAAVLRLWSQIAAGSPSLTSEYDPRLLRLLGTDLVLSALDHAPPEYSSPPRMRETRRLSRGVLVRVVGRGPGQEKPVPISFLLAKVNGRWKVRYDSNLTERIRGEVQARVRRGLPRTEEAEERAAVAANRAVLESRSLFAGGPRRGRLSAP